MIDFEALFKVSYGLYIVSSGNTKDGNGFISNSVFQVTAEPVKFAACCNKENLTAKYIANSKVFAISVLHQEASAQLVGKFGYKSGKDINKFEGTSFIEGQTGVPIVTDESVAYIECKLVDTFDVGTHLVFIGEAVQSEILTEEEPLTYAYYRKIKKGLAPKNAPTYVDKSKLQNKEAPKASVSTTKDKKYKCPACGYIYDPETGDQESGIQPGTPFEDIPDEWVCPLCGTEKEDFFAI